MPTALATSFKFEHDSPFGITFETSHYSDAAHLDRSSSKHQLSAFVPTLGVLGRQFSGDSVLAVLRGNQFVANARASAGRKSSPSMGSSARPAGGIEG